MGSDTSGTTGEEEIPRSQSIDTWTVNTIAVHARAIFVRMIFDGADLIAAQEARELFMREHQWCKRCDTVKHVSLFVRQGPTWAFPCKDCRHKQYTERRAAEKAGR